ncbi:hypothetical protein LGN33_14990 [Burkholderia cepacia]|uniref:hypothetical protein n=1 Tax=Burkholderia cepacia TaxID=292 RepID=UPI001CF1CEA9|nr:hypothetical protein [Burkholderia cepacia]
MDCKSLTGHVGLSPVRCALAAVPCLFLAQLRHAFYTGALHFYGQLEVPAEIWAFTTFLAPDAQAELAVHAKPPFGDA